MRSNNSSIFLNTGCASVLTVLFASTPGAADETITVDQGEVDFSEDNSTLTISNGVTVEGTLRAIDVTGTGATIKNYGTLKSEGLGIDSDGGGDVAIYNEGDIISETDTSDDVLGVYVEGTSDSVTISNTGTVTATVEDEYYARGIYLLDVVGPVTIDNSGEVTATTQSDYTSIGIQVENATYSAVGDIDIENTGAITAFSVEDDVGGILVVNSIVNSVGVVKIVNESSGTIDVTSGDDGYGIDLRAKTTDSIDDISLINSGSIIVDAGGDAKGLNVFNDPDTDLSSTNISNLGTIELDADDDATGIDVHNKISGNQGDFSITNSGTLIARGLDDATGIEVDNSVDGDLSKFVVYSSGDMVLEAEDDGFGIQIENSVDGDYENLSIYNLGSITIDAVDLGGGIDINNSSDSEDARVEIFNSGDISVETDAQARAISIYQEGIAGTITIENSAILTVQSTNVAAFGIYVEREVTESETHLLNTGEIIAAGGSDSYGVYAVNDNGKSTITFSNSGKISAQTAISLQDQVVELNLYRGSVIDGDVYVGGSEFNIHIGDGQNLALDYTLDSTETPVVSVNSQMPFVHDEANGAVYTFDPTTLAAHQNYLQTLTNVVSNIVDGNSKLQGKNALWGEAFGGYQTQPGNGILSTVNQTYGGIVSGGSKNLDDYSLGLFAGGALNKLKNQHDTQEVTAQTALAGAYAAFNQKRYWVSATLTGGYAWFNSDRTVLNNTVSGGVETATADYSGFLIAPSLAVGANLGKRVSVGVRGQYAGLFLNDYEEEGSGANLSFDKYQLHAAAIRAQADILAFELTSDTGVLSSSIRFGADGYFDLEAGTSNATLAGLPLDIPDYQDDTTIGFAGLALNYTSANGMWQFSGDVEGLYGTDDFREVRSTLAAKILF